MLDDRSTENFQRGMLMIFRYNSVRSISGLLLTVTLLAAGCSSPVRKPSMAQSNLNPSGEGENGQKSNDLKKEDQTKKPGGSTDASALKAIVIDPTTTCKDETSPNTPVLRMLTRTEYRNSVKDLFGLTSDYGEHLPLENMTHGFRNNTLINQVTDAHLEAYLSNAKDIAAEIIPNMQKIAGCSVTAGASCAATFIKDIGSRIWRRPLTTEESARMNGLFKTGAAFSNDEGFGLVIRAFLSSPYFIYRTEIGSDGSLDAYELASALSYFLWSTVPDETLRKNAESGAILKEATLVSEAKRLLTDPKGRAAVVAFADSYLNYSAVLNVSKDGTKFANFTSKIREAMAKETEDTMDYWIRKKQAGFSTLFSSDMTVGDPMLAQFYKSQSKREGDLSILSHTDTTRRGVLGMGSILASLATANETHPIKRGEFVTSHLLCDVLPPPPVAVPFPAAKPGLSTRERFAAHSVPACAGCHKKLDGTGFGMEDFDAVGVYRQMDEGKPVDSSGDLFEVDDQDQHFSGIGELSALLAQSRQAKRCFAVQLFQQAQGRFVAAKDVCGVRSIVDSFTSKDMTIADLIIKVITNPSYTARGEK
jgi:hypothetical protein